MGKFSKFSKLKLAIKIFPHFPKLQFFINWKSICHIYVLRCTPSTFWHWKYPILLSKNHIFLRVPWVRNFQITNFYEKISLNKKIRPISSVRLSQLINSWKNSIWLYDTPPLTQHLAHIFTLKSLEFHKTSCKTL